MAARNELEREIDLMKERLEANQRVLDATKAELDLRENRLSMLDREVMVLHTCQRQPVSAGTSLDVLCVCCKHIQISFSREKEGGRRRG